MIQDLKMFQPVTSKTVQSSITYIFNERPLPLFNMKASKYPISFNPYSLRAFRVSIFSNPLLTCSMEAAAPILASAVLNRPIS